MSLLRSSPYCRRRGHRVDALWYFGSGLRSRRRGGSEVLESIGGGLVSAPAIAIPRCCCISSQSAVDEILFISSSRRRRGRKISRLRRPIFRGTAHPSRVDVILRLVFLLCMHASRIVPSGSSSVTILQSVTSHSFLAKTPKFTGAVHTINHTTIHTTIHANLYTYWHVLSCNTCQYLHVAITDEFATATVLRRCHGEHCTGRAGKEEAFCSKEHACSADAGMCEQQAT